jgi:hypothetical protein
VHGSWAAGACHCEADWVGPACDFHLLSGTAFLPPADPASARGRCAASREFEAAAAALRERLHVLQHEAPRSQCGNASRVWPVRLRNTNGHAGFASFVEQVTPRV